MNRYLYIFLFLCFCVETTFAQVSSGKQYKLPPRWVKHIPISHTQDMDYHVVIVRNASSETVQNLALGELMQQLPNDWEVEADRENSSIIKTQRENDKIAGSQREDIIINNVRSHGKEVQIRCRVVDTYWATNNTCYVLYQVLKPNGTGSFENVVLKTSYGAHGLYSMLVPGATQFYKGSYVKGGCMLGGTALLAGGVVWTHSTMKSYTNLENSTHSSQNKIIYHTKAQNYMVGRNVLIGAMAALYVYNVIDAFVAPGARRVVRTGGASAQYAVMPVVLEDATPAIAMRITF